MAYSALPQLWSTEELVQQEREETVRQRSETSSAAAGPFLNTTGCVLFSGCEPLRYTQDTCFHIILQRVFYTQLLIQFSSVQFSCPVVSDSLLPHESQHASLSVTNSQSSLKLTSIEWVMPSSHLILCHPLLLLPPIPPSIRAFSNESTLHMRYNLWSQVPIISLQIFYK